MDKVLFICIHNSARSQMAEAYLKDWGRDRFEVESAGMEPTEVNPLTIKVMHEEGYDLSDKKTRSVFELFKQGKLYSHVITVCEDSTEKDCPVFPGVAFRDHWPFPDPAAAQGNEAERLDQFRAVREQIKKRVRTFLDEQD